MWILDLISSWWHWVFVDLMGHSVVLMFLFGWEIFLAPIGFVIGIIFVALNALYLAVTKK